MVKKKVKREQERKEFQYSKELQGLILILIGIIGFGDFGIVGKVIKGFSIFLCGNWYILFLALSFLLGIYLLSKRKNPDYSSTRLIGLYILILSLLLFSHLSYLKGNNLKGYDIIKVTIDNVMLAVNNNNLIKNTGGGMLGSTFALVFVTLFEDIGTNIIGILMIIVGIIMLFDINLYDWFKNFIKLFKRKHKKEEHTSYETPKDNSVIITDINEIIDTKEKTDNEIDTEIYRDENDKDYILPPYDLLESSPKTGKINSTIFIESNNKILERVFNDFGIKGKVVEVHVGPTVTQYEIELASGTKVNKVLSINREIALALAAKEVRIQAPIPGKNTIGIEIPNPVQSSVKLRDILESLPKKTKNLKLLAPLGKDIMGNCQYFEINKAPHLLVAGATGSGKSVCINNFIVSLLMRTRPDEVKMILIDPKKVELNVYEGIPHLIRPVVTDAKKASVVLQEVVRLMEERYSMFNSTETKSLETYNEYVLKQNKKGNNMEKLPYIVVVVDELADLMMTSPKEVEASIIRLTQLARATGIHLIVTTQRPSTDVITGLIKANIPSRIAFAVSSSIDSRTILDMMGAEKLLGKGDMLFLPMGESVPIRIQGSYVSDDEIKKVVDFVRKERTPKYDEKFTKVDKENDFENDSYINDDPLYKEVLEFAVRCGKISTSLIQRKYRIGYNRAARMIDSLEEKGIIGPQNGSKPRDVLVKLKEENKEV